MIWQPDQVEDLTQWLRRTLPLAAYEHVDVVALAASLTDSGMVEPGPRLKARWTNV